jgi:hypothetical protein
MSVRSSTYRRAPFLPTVALSDSMVIDLAADEARNQLAVAHGVDD